MKNIIYGARVSGGSYDDHWETIKFVSLDKELVEKWVEKYNRILKKIGKFYEQRYLAYPKKGNYYSDPKLNLLASKHYKVDDFWEAVVEEIELR